MLEALFARVLVVGQDRQVQATYGRATDIPDDELLERLDDDIERGLSGEEHLRRIEASFASGPRAVTARIVPIMGPDDVITAVAVAIDRRARMTHALVPAPSQVRQLQFVLENIRHGIWRLGPDGTIVSANRHLAEWLETDESSLEGQPATRYLVSHSVAEMHLGAAHRYEAEFESETGIRRRALVDQMPVPDGDQQATFALITDLTADSVVRARLVAELKQMASLARQDPLTGLLNRRAFAQALEAAVERAEETPFGVLLIDIDHLKAINDQYGHEAGDQAISAIADRLRHALRESDTIARLGGDEFAVIAHGVSRAVFQELARRVERQLTVTLDHHEPPVTVTASVGGAHSLDGTAHLMRAADAAMYIRKKRQRGMGR